MQSLSSPWDVLLYTTPDMDMSVRPLLPPPPAPPGSASDKEKAGNEEAKGKRLVISHVTIVHRQEINHNKAEKWFARVVNNLVTYFKLLV